ncbi:hypothetical protein Bca52824_052190 [Brassica carinata]|uniref:Uncharacterized protein n=1 Tax=Brassica carinata TaxID=52824 RepID=A0A8X7R2R9_BRACI|nr:hypothetical protein Bca52824_052190 [Brassica carinata]
MKVSTGLSQLAKTRSLSPYPPAHVAPQRSGESRSLQDCSVQTSQNQGRVEGKALQEPGGVHAQMEAKLKQLEVIEKTKDEKIKKLEASESCLCDCIEGVKRAGKEARITTEQRGYPNWYNDELSARGFTGLEADWKTWAHSLKYFQVDLDKMEIIQLDPERDLRASPVSDGSRCNSLLLCRFMSWDLLTMVISSESRDEDLPAGEPLVINQFGLNLSSISAEDASAAVLPTQARE